MKKKVNIKLVLRVLLISFILFPFIQQRTYSELPGWISTFYKYYCLLSSTCIFIVVLFKREFNLFKNKQWLFLMFWMIYILTTIINSYQQLEYVLYQAYISLALITFIGFESKRNLKELLISLSIIYGFYILFNWIFFMIYPNGIYQTLSYHKGHLLGDDNAIIYVALPGLICLACNSIFNKKKISFFVWFMILITEYTFIKLWAVSSMVSLTIFIIGIIYASKTNGPNPKNVLIIVFCIIFLTLFGISNSNIQNFIVNRLHKDITLSGRTAVWSQAIDLITRRPILGYGGYFMYGRFRPHSYSIYTYPSHTPYLQLAIDGGIFLLLCFIVITITSYNNTIIYKNKIYTRVLAIGMGCMLINYITEYSQLIHYMIIITLMFNIKNYHQLLEE